MANENKIKSYKDIVARDTIFGRINSTSTKPKTTENNILKVATKIASKGKEFILPSRGFDLSNKKEVTLPSGVKTQIPDLTGSNFSKVSLTEKLKGTARYGAEMLALPEAIGNLILSGVSKATKIGEVKDSALQKRLIEFAKPKTKGEAETMRVLDVIGYLTPSGAVSQPLKKAANATRASVIKRKVPVASEAVTSKVNVGTPKTRQGDYAKSMGYEPIRPDSELPVIEMGTKPETTTGLPIIQRDVPTKPFTPPGLRYEPIKEIIEQGRQAPTLVDEAAASVQPSIRVKNQIDSSLSEEAKKYKSAEEFIKAKGVQRIEEPNISTSFDKPQGLYTSPSSVESPHSFLGGNKTEFGIKSNAKEVTVDTSGLPKNPMQRGVDQMATNLVWLRQKLPDVANSIRGKSFSDLKTMFSKEFPDVDWNKYDEIQDMIEGYAGLRARQEGIDVIRGVDKTDPQFDEVVILNKDVVLDRAQLEDIWNQSRPQAPDLSVPPSSSETITPKLSSDIEADAIAKNVVSKYEDLPAVPKMNMEEGISNASKLAVDDFERAKRIALGDESVPAGTEIGMVYEAVKQKAVKDNNWELLRELATNPNAAPTQATRAGQVVKSFDTMSDSVDPVELMQSVAKSREKGVNILKKADKGATIKSAKEAVSKAKPNKDAWVDFINSIEC